MFFEAITLTTILLATKSYIASRSAKYMLSGEKLDISKTDSEEQVSVPSYNYIFDENQKERCNEIFLNVYSILIASNKSLFNQLITSIKQIVDIFRISSLLGCSEDKAKHISGYFKDYVSKLDKGDLAVERFDALRPLLEYYLREMSGNHFLDNYFRDMYKDTDYIKKVLPSIYGCFDLIIYDSFSESKNEIKSENIKNYKCLLGAAGIVYDKLVKVLLNYNLFDTRGRLSYELLYETANYILKMTNFYFCKGLTTERLAKDITDSIIHYIHNDVSINKEFCEKYRNQPQKYVDKLIERYLMNREIENYYYFLKMACKVLEALHYTEIQNEDNKDHKERIKIAMEKLPKLNLSILENYDEREILRDIEMAYEHKDVVLQK